MGGSASAFNKEELEEYQELTYFTRKEILVVHKRFRDLDPERVMRDKNATISKDKIEEVPELKVNPFKDRICEVFSSDGSGNMSFEDFLDMMSVFSEHAPKAVKVEYAFKIYDFDGDDMIGVEDIKEVIHRLTGDEQELSQEDLDILVDNIFEEADLDSDRNLSFAEFEHVITKAPDFVNSFRIRL